MRSQKFSAWLLRLRGKLLGKMMKFWYQLKVTSRLLPLGSCSQIMESWKRMQRKLALSHHLQHALNGPLSQ
jgi:hypothetical protein